MLISTSDFSFFLPRHGEVSTRSINSSQLNHIQRYMKKAEITPCACRFMTTVVVAARNTEPLPEQQQRRK